jgi:amylosucrase
MPLLTPRPRPNDGGYAVADYRQVRPDLGSMDDLARLAAVLRGYGISLTLDLVLNHVAYEHEWARLARGGDPRYRNYFHVFPSRERPDAYEATMPEGFPDQAPGSFSWDPDLNGWVWTTFNTWQWDLNWHNPEVFCEFADIMLFLANQGVEVLRLDAIAFIWKRLGTTCQNQPEVHAVTQALHALTRIAAPGLLFKAEAIVGPADLAAYLGVGEHAGKVSDLAYHNSLMVQVWSSLATGDARLAEAALRRFAPPPASTSWATYLRCHDDIGWAIGDDDAAAVGWNGHAHRLFLSDWYSGEFPGSPARGLVFQHNPITQDRRISGTAASLAGLEEALAGGDPAGADLAIRRLMLAHAIVLSFGGLPLIFMGDELALRNDYGYERDPEHAGDNRWVHRPVMPWDVAELRHAPGTLEHRVWHQLRHLVAVRAAQPAMDASVPARILGLGHQGVLGWFRPHPVRPLVALHNVAGREHRWPRYAVPLGGPLLDAVTGAEPAYVDGELWLQPYQALWLVPAG